MFLLRRERERERARERERDRERREKERGREIAALILYKPRVEPLTSWHHVYRMAMTVSRLSIGFLVPPSASSDQGFTIPPFTLNHVRTAGNLLYFAVADTDAALKEREEREREGGRERGERAREGEGGGWKGS